MSFAVQAQQLRSAANTYSGVADSLGSGFSITKPSPAGLGHVELAAWLTQVVVMCISAHEALGAGATAIAGGLTSSASAYEITDDAAGSRLSKPFAGDGPLSQSPTFPGAPTGGGAR